MDSIAKAVLAELDAIADKAGRIKSRIEAGGTEMMPILAARVLIGLTEQRNRLEAILDQLQDGHGNASKT